MALRGIAHGVRCCARGAGAGVRAAARRPYVHAVGLNVRVPQYQPHRRMLLFAQRLLGTGGERSCSSSSSSSFEDPRERILDFALARVDEDGWSELALAKGAKDAGLPSVASGMFTRGAVELVEHFMTSSLEELKVQCGKRSQELDPLSAEERLVEAMMIRLEAIQPHISSWPQAMALGLLPHNAPRTAQALADIADELAFQTGDRSTDGRWYAKRAVVAGAYISAELYMLTDKSEGFRDTR
jgi:ubiquinone biosynthesis protein COQ9